MKTVDEIKDEITSLLNEAARQGVFITTVRAEYISTVAGVGAAARVEMTEDRMR